jgi:hypothetical protein
MRRAIDIDAALCDFGLGDLSAMLASRAQRRVCIADVAG